MTNLQVFNNDSNLELVIDNQTGESFASQRATARMCSIDEATVRRFIAAAGIQIKTVEISTAGGLQGAALLDENQMMQVMAKYNPNMLITFAQVGLRTYLHQLAGFKVTSTAIEPKLPQNYLEALKVLVVTEEEKQAALLLAAERQETIEAQQPKVDAFQATIDADGCHSMITLSKMLQVSKDGKPLGRNLLMKELRRLNILMKDNQPYQTVAHWFKVITSVIIPGNPKVTYSSQLKAEYLPDFIKYLSKHGLIVSYINQLSTII